MLIEDNNPSIPQLSNCPYFFRVLREKVKNEKKITAPIKEDYAQLQNEQSADELFNQEPKKLSPSRLIKSKLTIAKEQMMKIRADESGKLLNRSLLGNSDIYHKVEQRRQLKEEELQQSSKKHKISDFLNQKRNYNIITTYSKRNSTTIHTNSNKNINQGNGYNHQNPNPYYQGAEAFNHQRRSRDTKPFYDRYINQTPNSGYLSLNSQSNTGRKENAAKRFEDNQKLWDTTSSFIKGKIRPSGVSLLDKQRHHAIQIKDEQEAIDHQTSRRGRSVDMQHQLRSFYQNIRDSQICYTTVQTKNPFTMIWATDPSPSRVKSGTFEQSFITSTKNSAIGKNRSPYRPILIYNLNFKTQMDNYTIKLNATHSHLKIRLAEIRFDRRNTIRQVKEVLERKFGTNADDMTIELRDSSDNFLQVLHNDQETIAHYGPQEGYTFHVIDAAPASYGDLDDVSQVEKYQISEEEYNKRDDTFRKFKTDMQKQDPTFMKKAGNKIPDDFQKEEADQVSVGQRCEIIIGQRRGEVKFVGKIPELAPGFWVGVQLDEPTGDSDGTVKGNKYFEAVGGSKFGVIIRPKDARFGDFPPLDDFDENEDEI
ncbi:UNKNOWN [Stylonychia lemnae]|uniref:CAP-Gly domain-containing protein n=1 Tax=Stylonychia lemnae TaxID=5949 RepID=A0A078B7D8_STYLE|nr:UNKNOWN [Stylonychia lemnae]|eukprot:CDW90329.1 UNKNOWN [Stylonychia lemnae]